MLTAAAATTIQAPPLLQSSSSVLYHHHGSSNAALTYIITRRRRRQLISLHLTTSPSRHNRGFLLSLVTAASKSPNSNSNSNSNADDEDDLYFLLKLGAGSFAGAAAIKYGSILVPEITRPNITLALIMISTPVLVSILILIKVVLNNNK